MFVFSIIHVTMMTNDSESEEQAETGQDDSE